MHLVPRIRDRLLSANESAMLAILREDCSKSARLAEFFDRAPCVHVQSANPAPSIVGRLFLDLTCGRAFVLLIGL